MRFAFRFLNAAVALATLASAVVVLVSDVTDPAYRAHYRDAIWFVAAYCAVQLGLLVEFARGGPSQRLLVLAKTAAAYGFLLALAHLWPYWKVWTPARYVYLIFELPSGSQVGLMALVLLGRGAFNTVNVMVYTEEWWYPLRLRRPILGRVVTAAFVGVTVLCVWLFFGLVREEARTFSGEAQEVAEMVLATLDCDAIRAHTGQSTADVRQHGDRTYGVAIAYDCPTIQVRVHAEDGRVGTAAATRPECCGEPS